MDTPDDEVRPYADVPPAAEVPDDEVVLTDPDDQTLLAEAEPRPRVLLSLLAGIVVGLLGVVVFAIVYVAAKREFPGVAVVTGFAVGWVMREVARRSTVLVRVLAAVVTAVAVVAGTIIGQVAYTTKEFHAKFFQLLKDVAPDTLRLLNHRSGVQKGIYVAAVVIAVLAAWPSKPKPVAAPVHEEPEPAHDPE